MPSSGKRNLSRLQQLRHWLKRWQLSGWIVLLLVAVGAGLRLWNLPDSYQFLGDQGRDAIVVKHLLYDRDPILIGPVTSTGNMYLGPLYYYWMAPWLALTYPNPIGPVYAIAALSILTIAAMYWVGKELFGRWPAVIGAFFYTFSWLAISYGRFSWNPNPEPLVTVFLVWCVFRAFRRSVWYWLGAALACSVLIQLHYVTLLAIPATGTIWLIQLVRIIRLKKPLLPMLSVAVLGAGVFLLSLLPLVLFDFRHNFLNARNFENFVLHSQSVGSDVGQKIAVIVKETQGRSMQLLFESHLGKTRWLNFGLVLATTVSLIYLWLQRHKEYSRLTISIVISFLAWTVLGLSFYRSSVFDHYIAYMWPIVFWTYGILIYQLWTKSKYRWLGAAISLAFTGLFLLHNLPLYPLKSQGQPASKIAATAANILQRLQPNEKYNIVLLTGTGDIEGQNYRYFLETSNHPPLPQAEWGNIDTLFIINDDRKIKKVTDSPIYEIVVFPNKQPADVYTIPNGPEITVLRR